MTPQQFIAKWQAARLSERSACQQHFLDLCELLGLAHKKLDTAVFGAYGWDPAITDDELLAKLLELNLQRAAAQT